MCERRAPLARPASGNQMEHDDAAVCRVARARRPILDRPEVALGSCPQALTGRSASLQALRRSAFVSPRNFLPPSVSRSLIGREIRTVETYGTCQKHPPAYLLWHTLWKWKARDRAASCNLTEPPAANLKCRAVESASCVARAASYPILTISGISNLDARVDTHEPRAAGSSPAVLACSIVHPRFRAKR